MISYLPYNGQRDKGVTKEQLGGFGVKTWRHKRIRTTHKSSRKVQSHELEAVYVWLY